MLTTLACVWAVGTLWLAAGIYRDSDSGELSGICGFLASFLMASAYPLIAVLLIVMGLCEFLSELQHRSKRERK